MKKNYFWGVFLVLAGAYLIVSQMGYLPSVGAFTLVFTIVCIAALIQGVLHMSFGAVLFPLAFIGILYDKQLGITAITPWTILIAALLGTVGLNLIFGRFKKKFKYRCYGGHGKGHKGGGHGGKGENVDGENIEINVSFGSVIRYVTSSDLRYTDINVSFGAATVYFDNAKIPSGNATVNINSDFAGVELYVPGNWQVINHMNSSFGAVDEKNKRSGELAGTLTLEGSNSFGGITIYYV
ncbi:MAG: hypothetical protein J1F22_00030 [Lachnospiraceae bacterium]|nr:hypothetical protein [Lachnospiraceae bacterium]